MAAKVTSEVSRIVVKIVTAAKHMLSDVLLQCLKCQRRNSFRFRNRVSSMQGPVLSVVTLRNTVLQ
jgi:hypothetical protein